MTQSGVHPIACDGMIFGESHPGTKALPHPWKRPIRQASHCNKFPPFVLCFIFTSFIHQMPDNTASIAATNALAWAATLSAGCRKSLAGNGAA